MSVLGLLTNMVRKKNPQKTQQTNSKKKLAIPPQRKKVKNFVLEGDKCKSDLWKLISKGGKNFLYF